MTVDTKQLRENEAREAAAWAEAFVPHDKQQQWNLAQKLAFERDAGRREAADELDALRAVRNDGCQCSDDEACAFVRERDALRADHTANQDTLRALCLLPLGVEHFGDLVEAVKRVIEERDAIRALVREWLCTKCRTVYPGPPRPGLMAVMCPKCDDASCMPHEFARRRELEAELAEARATVERLTAPATESEAIAVFNKISANQLYSEVFDAIIARRLQADTAPKPSEPVRPEVRAVTREEGARAMRRAWAEQDRREGLEAWLAVWDRAVELISGVRPEVRTADEIVEACAKVCDSYAAERLAAIAGRGPDEATKRVEERFIVAKHLADDIRALRGTFTLADAETLTDEQTDAMIEALGAQDPDAAPKPSKAETVRPEVRTAEPETLTDEQARAARPRVPVAAEVSK